MIHSQIGQLFNVNPCYTGEIEGNLNNPSETYKGAINIEFEPSGNFKINTQILKNSVSGKQELESIQIKASQGKISNISFSKNIDISDVTDNLPLPFNLKLHIEAFEFEHNLDTEVKYWIFPLTNFIADFIQEYSDLNYPYQAEAIKAKFFPHRLINFRLRNNQCWIEPLSDYEERKKKLISGEICCTITSIMVGEIDSMSINSDDINKDFTFNLLNVLGLATGTQIQASWIEFRDANYQLIKRIHWNIQPIQYTKGHVAIKGNDLKPNSGIGHLLEKSLSSIDFNKPHLQNSLTYNILGGNPNQYLEFRKINFILALDMLSRFYGYERQDLKEGLENSEIDTINGYLNNASRQIQSLANDAKAAGNFDKSQIIGKIADRTKQIPVSIDRSFGLTVVKLIKHFNLLDSDIITEYYGDNHRDFARVLSYYRGAIIHEGYFNFDSEDYNFEDVVRVLKHLHDILIRLNLIMLEYRGHYITPISNSPKLVNWVNVSTLASELGYK
ncbi:MAG: hypothetical protein HEQ33_22775 [Dolichospermum sp. WA123]|jgi:hypothetical protein|nr:hypothetical protein [Dolichospermum sp. WA123]